MPEPTSGPGSARLDRWARLRRWARSRRVVVRDGSMRPTLWPGDRLLVDPAAFRYRPPGLGQLVVVRDPEGTDRWLVKRVEQVAGGLLAGGTRVPNGTVYVQGDDAAASRDSRAFGPVPLGLVVGRPWFRDLPEERRGPVGEDAA
jgi:hypothetical protein